VTYQLPQTVPLRGGRVAELHHATDYTETPLAGEDRPPVGQLFAYYVVGEMRVRVPLVARQAKLSSAYVTSAVERVVERVLPSAAQ
jgi:hypothetical protein